MPRNFRPFTVNPKAFHELVLMPMFGDYIPTNGPVQPSLEEGDWTVMDNVKWRVPIIEIRGNQNVLKRRDHTCKLIYTPVGRITQRYVYAEEFYVATEDCVKEFYQGCFIDYSRENRQMFFERIMPILETAAATDIYTNKYFGDVERAPDATGTFSWNKFDGIFTHLASYIADGITPSTQTFAIDPDDSGGILTTTETHDYLQAAYDAQGFMMKSVPNSEKAIYVDYAVYESYWDYLVYSGQSTVAERQASPSNPLFRGIEIRPKTWDPILSLLNGGVQTHIILLTLRSNFLYLTDSSYGGGFEENEAVRVWYSVDDDVWRRQIHIKAGTEWVNPEYVVYGATEF